jgi:hypothetical protein
MERRRTKNKRTRMAKSRKMTRSKTRKLRKKYKRGGARGRYRRYTGINSANKPGEAERLLEALLVERREAAEQEAAERLAYEAYSKFYNQTARSSAATAAALRMIRRRSVKDQSPQEVQTPKTRGPPSVKMSEKSKFARYNEKLPLCEKHTEEDPCDQQQGCNWNGDMEKCLPSSEVMDTGTPTSGSPSLQYLTDEENDIREQDILLNKILLASFGYNENGARQATMLDLTDTNEVYKFIKTKDEAEALIQRIIDKQWIIDKQSEMGNDKYDFPNTTREGSAENVKEKMSILTKTLETLIKDDEEDDEEDAL